MMKVCCLLLAEQVADTCLLSVGRPYLNRESAHLQEGPGRDLQEYIFRGGGLHFRPAQVQQCKEDAGCCALTHMDARPACCPAMIPDPQVAQEVQEAALHRKQELLIPADGGKSPRLSDAVASKARSQNALTAE